MRLDMSVCVDALHLEKPNQIVIWDGGVWCNSAILITMFNYEISSILSLCLLWESYVLLFE
jgi:hypothetical protein